MLLRIHLGLSPCSWLAFDLTLYPNTCYLLEWSASQNSNTIEPLIIHRNLVKQQLKGLFLLNCFNQVFVILTKIINHKLSIHTTMNKRDFLYGGINYAILLVLVSYLAMVGTNLDL